jgi:hypothetical protein
MLTNRGKFGIHLHETVLNASATVERKPPRSRGLISRYWAESVVLAIAVLLWAPRLSGPIDLRWDGGVYYVLGTSLATGQGYRILSEPGSPEAVQYPPLLPAIVAVCQRFLGSKDPTVVAPWLRILYAVLFLGYALAVLALAKRYLRPVFAVTAVAFTLLQPNTIFVSDVLYTEIPFALVSVLFVLVAVNGPFSSRPWLREIASFLLATAGFLLRTVGVALLAAWVLEAIVRRRWQLAVVRVVLAMLPLIGWEAYVMRVTHSYEYAHPAYAYQRAPYQPWNVSYAENMKWLMNSSHRDWRHARPMSLPSQLQENTGRLIESIGETISPSGRVPTLVLSAFALVGLAMLVHRRAWMMVFIILISLVIIWPWPWPDQFYRFLVPLTPFLIIGVMMFFSALISVLSTPEMRPAIAIVGRIVLAALLLAALTLQVSSVWKLFYDRAIQGTSYLPGGGAAGPHYFYYSESWRDWDAGIAWIQSHSHPNAIVLTRSPQLCYLRTGRRAVMPPVEQNQDRARQLLESVPVSYVLLELPVDYIPAVEKDSQRWRSVESVKPVRLYERISGRE